MGINLYTLAPASFPCTSSQRRVRVSQGQLVLRFGRQRPRSSCTVGAYALAEAESGVEEDFREFLKSKPRIILGSQSESRRQIMDDLGAEYGFTYEVRVAGIDEKAIRSRDPTALVALLAQAKAEAIVSALQLSGAPLHGWLVTCDQVVVHDGLIKEKPESLEQARQWIARYAEETPRTVGSVLVTNLSTMRSSLKVDEAAVHFNRIPDSVVDQLLEEGSILRCAGGLMVEHPMVQPHIRRMAGTQDTVMGLRKQSVLQMLLETSP